MKLYDTVPEAIEIARNTYKGRTYIMGAYEETADGSEKLAYTITGDACTIYGEQTFLDLKGANICLWPIDDNDVEGMALMETIFVAKPMGRAPITQLGKIALDFLNHIVAEVEDQ